ncbi:jg4442 [Pararge aegeria aegeria]|uniref:Jg4442 protein n=1 Tax=Pararge aegeria aegeria TaxID=348720 RepID=A0A8S4S6N5_9NEOP|nr:jg4442 [Pararge aegeria aegeria]
MDCTEHDNEMLPIDVQTANCVNEYYERMENIEMTRQGENVEIIDENMDEENIGLRPPKRNRPVDQEEVWTTVTRRGKRIVRTHDSVESVRIPEDKIEVNITSTATEKIPKQFKLAKILKAEGIQDITRVKYVNAFKVTIQFNNDDSADKLMESKYFKEKGFKCQRTFDINETYGVIKHIDLDSTEEEIQESLRCNVDIIAVKRLKRRSSINGQWEPSEVVRICFRGSSLPRKVYIFDTVSTVTPYLYPVTQCARCWRYGHSVRVCPSNKIICPKCSDYHANCNTTTFKCNNCNGKHMALARTCPIYKKEKRIRELMAEFNCSYKRALTIYVPPDPPNHCNYTEQPSEVEVDEEYTDEEKNSFSMQGKRTYANILKKSSENKGNPKNKMKKDNTKEKTQKAKCTSKEDDGINNYHSSESETEGVQNTEERTSKHNSNKITWRKILKQVKEKIFDSKLSLEEKVKTCAKIIFDLIKHLVLKYLSDQPFFSYIRQWITDTNT